MGWRLRKDRNRNPLECERCGGYFTSTESFDAHQTEHAKADMDKAMTEAYESVQAAEAAAEAALGVARAIKPVPSQRQRERAAKDLQKLLRELED